MTGQVAPDSRCGAAPILDPNEVYTEAVKSSLIDAMLKHSVGLKLGADEWLTVAASDPGPDRPGIASTILIRIKGAISPLSTPAGSPRKKC